MVSTVRVRIIVRGFSEYIAYFYTFFESAVIFSMQEMVMTVFVYSIDKSHLFKFLQKAMLTLRPSSGYGFEGKSQGICICGGMGSR